MSPAGREDAEVVLLNIPVKLSDSATGPVADMLMLPLGALSEKLTLLIVAPLFILN